MFADLADDLDAHFRGHDDWGIHTPLSFPRKRESRAFKKPLAFLGPWLTSIGLVYADILASVK
jgi:hypothetical protein